MDAEHFDAMLRSLAAASRPHSAIPWARRPPRLEVPSAGHVANPRIARIASRSTESGSERNDGRSARSGAPLPHRREAPVPT
jgi:hypothetical protein